MEKTPLQKALAIVKKGGPLAAPADLRAMLASSPKAKATWDDITPLARRDWIVSIVSAKLAETRERRVEKARDLLSRGKRRVCCFEGVPWLLRKEAEAQKAKKR